MSEFSRSLPTLFNVLRALAALEKYLNGLPQPVSLTAPTGMHERIVDRLVKLFSDKLVSLGRGRIVIEVNDGQARMWLELAQPLGMIVMVDEENVTRDVLQLMSQANENSWPLAPKPVEATL